MNNGHFLPTQKNEMPSSEPVVETEEMKSKPYFPPYPAFARGSTIGDPVSVEEKGRTWQNYKPGKYFLPNDAVEQDRLDFTHAGFRLLLGGDLYRSPLQGEPGRVLDIGTGTGRNFTNAVKYAY